MRFIVENYAAAGCTCEKRSLEFRSLDKARAEVRRRLKVQALRAERQWKPRWPGAIEAWHGLLGVRTAGGVVIFRERAEPAKVAKAPPRSPGRRKYARLENPSHGAPTLDAANVLQVIRELGRVQPRVRLGDLKRELGSPEQAEFSRVLLALQDRERVILMRNDNPMDVTAQDKAAAIYIAGNPRHLVFLQ